MHAMLRRGVTNVGCASALTPDVRASCSWGTHGRLQREERGRQGRADERGKNGKDQRSFGCARTFGHGTSSAQPCCLSARQRTDANGCPESTSWGSLVRARPPRQRDKSPAKQWHLALFCGVLFSALEC